MKMTPSLLIILHTFGSELSLHYHIYILVSGEGLTKDKTDFKKYLPNTFSCRSGPFAASTGENYGRP